MFGTSKNNLYSLQKLDIRRREFNSAWSLFYFALPSNVTITEIIFYKASQDSQTLNIEIIQMQESSVIIKRLSGVLSNYLISINLRVDGGLYAVKITSSKLSKGIIYYR